LLNQKPTIMCLGFPHAGDSLLIDEIANSLGVEKYFMISIGKLNYLYTDNEHLINSVRNILGSKRIGFEVIQESDMMELVQEPVIRQYENFSGSVMLFNRFKETMA